MEQELKSWWTRKILSFQWWGSTSSSKAPTPASQDGQMCNFSSEHARNPRFLGMGNHLEPF